VSDGRRYGRKRSNGQPLLKEVFKSAVLGATKSETAFKRKYDEMRSGGADDRAARNGVARMMAATVLAVWKTGKRYNDKQREVTQRRQQKRRSAT
jgi:hypothetical protein